LPLIPTTANAKPVNVRFLPPLFTTILGDGIDVLIHDWKLPLLGGLEVFWELKNRNRTPPTLIVTAYPGEGAESMGQRRAMSVAGCLINPFDPPKMLEIIQEIENERPKACRFPARLSGE
jgi:DNA-binding response OmpR family regulator